MRLIDTFVTLSFFIPLINSVRSPLEDVAQSRLQLKSLDRISSPKCFDFSFGDGSFPQRTAIFLPILSSSMIQQPLFWGVQRAGSRRDREGQLREQEWQWQEWTCGQLGGGDYDDRLTSARPWLLTFNGTFHLWGEVLKGIVLMFGH